MRTQCTTGIVLHINTRKEEENGETGNPKCRRETRQEELGEGPNRRQDVACGGKPMPVDAMGDTGRDVRPRNTMREVCDGCSIQCVERPGRMDSGERGVTEACICRPSIGWVVRVVGDDSV